MPYSSARARAEDAAFQLELSEPVTLASIQEHLETLRGRGIVIRPMEGVSDNSVCGLWFGLDDVDLVFHSDAVSEMHRQQIVLHEFAHMVLRHDQEVVSSDYASTLFPDLDSGAVVTALKRTDVHNAIEASAEILADLLASRIRSSCRVAGGPPQNFKAIFG